MKTSTAAELQCETLGPAEGASKQQTQEGIIEIVEAIALADAIPAFEPELPGDGAINHAIVLTVRMPDGSLHYGIAEGYPHKGGGTMRSRERLLLGSIANCLVGKSLDHLSPETFTAERMLSTLAPPPVSAGYKRERNLKESFWHVLKKARQALRPLTDRDLDRLRPIMASTVRAAATLSPDIKDRNLAIQRYLLHARQYFRAPRPPAPQLGGRMANAYPDVDAMRPLGNADPKSHLLERESLRLGLSTLRLSKSAFIAKDAAKRSIAFKLSRSVLTTGPALALSTHKDATRLYLSELGLPVPPGRMFSSDAFDQIPAFAEEIGYPVVVKPATGVRGIGVVPGIRDADELQRAVAVFRASRLGHDDVIVEKHVRGQDYRMMVVNGRLIAATLRAPANVVGDGQNTIGQLILQKNAARLQNPHLRSRLIKAGPALDYQLERAGLTLESVPSQGITIQLSGSCNLSQGGDNVNILEEMHPEIVRIAEKAVTAIPGFDYCGIDFLIEDHTLPPETQEIGICELNAHAAVGTARYPMYGAPVNVPLEVVRASAQSEGLRVADAPVDHLCVELTIRGRVQGVDYPAWFARQAANSDVAGWIDSGSDRTLRARLDGNAVAVSALVTAAIRGPSRAQPTSVQTVHVPPEAVGSGRGDFVIRQTANRTP